MYQICHPSLLSSAHPSAIAVRSNYPKHTVPILPLRFLSKKQFHPNSPMALIDPRSGFCSRTKVFHSLRPSVPLPPLSDPLTVTSYVFSLLPSPLPSNPALIDSSTDVSISYPKLLSQIQSLALSLKNILRLSKGDVAFILAPTSPDVPILYLALLSLGVVVSPSNPISSASEISHQLALTSPAIAFAVSSTASKLPSNLPKILIDSDKFRSCLAGVPAGRDTALSADTPACSSPDPSGVWQTDLAAILYSSGTTGRVKGVALSHRNFISILAGYKFTELPADAPPIGLFTTPLFHVFGFFMVLRSIAMTHTTVLMERFDFVKMLEAVERYRVTYMPVSPPLVVALAKSDLVTKYDLSSLEILGCGGAPLGKEVSEKFKERFPNVYITQGYGLTESTGGIATLAREESDVYGSAGRIGPNTEAKIVDPSTEEALGPGQRGELWLRGPTMMMGYVGDDQATASTLTSDGWLKTGDLCYSNEDGFIFIVDRLKELIKYKAYQVPPAELEHILQSQQEIADAAVIPYPDEEAGEIPMAFIVRQPGSTLNEEEVMDFVAKQVAPYKKIRRVAFVSSIPKSAAGKILRRELIQQALSKPTSKL